NDLGLRQFRAASTQRAIAAHQVIKLSQVQRRRGILRLRGSAVNDQGPLARCRVSPANRIEVRPECKGVARRRPWEEIAGGEGACVVVTQKREIEPVPERTSVSRCSLRGLANRGHDLVCTRLVLSLGQ